MDSSQRDNQDATAGNLQLHKQRWRSGDAVRVLLVEDDENHAALIERCLRMVTTPNHLRHVFDGQAALEFLQRCVDDHEEPLPDLILLDLNLPRVGGYEVLASLKESVATRSIPVVVLSAADAESDRATAYALHANSYVLKSPDLGAFSDMLGDLLRYWGNWNLFVGGPDQRARNNAWRADEPRTGSGRA